MDDCQSTYDRVPLMKRDSVDINRSVPELVIFARAFAPGGGLLDRRRFAGEPRHQSGSQGHRFALGVINSDSNQVLSNAEPVDS